jgi:hypothetical protein
MDALTRNCFIFCRHRSSILKAGARGPSGALKPYRCSMTLTMRVLHVFFRPDGSEILPYVWCDAVVAIFKTMANRGVH